MSEIHNSDKVKNLVEFLSAPISITEQVWDENVSPLVSISCITYNHENFIRDAIEGFLMQKTTFPIEILIHDDASTDNTANIIREYEARYPQLIRPLYQTENQYSKGDGTIGRIQHGRAIGKYYATCEGDDYWTDPLKLQKQVDFLEENTEYGLVHTDFIVSNEKRSSFNNYPKNDQYLNGFLKGELTIGTLTVLFRNDIYKSLPKYFQEKNFKMGDLPLWIEFSYVSKIKYLSDKTSMYRVSEKSASHSSSIDEVINFRKSSLEVKLFYMERFNRIEFKENAINSFYSGIVKLSFEKDNKEYAKQYFDKIHQFGRPSFKTKLFFYGTKYKTIRRTIDFLYKIIN